MTAAPLLQVSVTELAVLVAATPALTEPKTTLAAETVQKFATVAVTLKFEGPAVRACAVAHRKGERHSGGNRHDAGGEYVRHGHSFCLVIKELHW